jgi:uncharacterized membrane protein
MNDEHKNEKHGVESPSWFERNVNTIIIGLIVACVLTVLAQLVFPMFDEHHPPHFPQYENMIGFQAIFGFAAFVIVVFLGKGLRLIIKRKEDYYDA